MTSPSATASGEEAAGAEKAKAASTREDPKKRDGKKDGKDGAKASKDGSKDGSKDAKDGKKATPAEEPLELGLLKAPISTLRLAGWSMGSYTWTALVHVLQSWITWLLAVPLLIAWLVAREVLLPELFAPPVCGEREGAWLWWVELAIKEALWWIVLGILSSVGFGTGLHSGMMFLFPHVMQVVAAAEGCHTVIGLATWYHHPCKFDCHTTFGPKDDSTVTVVRLWLLVTLQCMLWGAGTAMGELPPYMISRGARLAGGSDAAYEAELAEAREAKDVFNRMKMWTVGLIEKHGFLAVFLLASWPNAAFDMCGMCCGYVLMPFWTFFIATLLGKGIVKVNGQAFFFINLFGSNFFKLLLSFLDSVNTLVEGLTGVSLGLAPAIERFRSKLVREFASQSRFSPSKLLNRTLDLSAVRELYRERADSDAVAARVVHAWDADHDGIIQPGELQKAVSVTDGKVSLSSLDPGTGTNPLKMLWELFIVALVLYFVVSVVDQLAKSEQAHRREQEAKKSKKKD